MCVHYCYIRLDIIVRLSEKLFSHLLRIYCSQNLWEVMGKCKVEMASAIREYPNEKDTHINNKNMT